MGVAMPVTPADERPFSASTTSNFVARNGGLPPRVRAIARAIMREKPETTLSAAIALAIHAVETTAKTGRVFGGKQQAKPSTIAAHTAATAQWEALRASAKARHLTQQGATVTTIALHTPVLERPAQAVGKQLWRKQILPLGHITYEGRRVDFDRDYLNRMAAAFQDPAADPVKLMLADKDNNHTMDPDRMRGTVRQVEVTDEGLFALIDADPDADALLAKHPDLGVSARILENAKATDGHQDKHFPAVMKHVLLTTEPFVSGMQPWSRVDLSAQSDLVIDLSSTAWPTKGTTMTKPNGQDPMAALLASMSDEQKALLHTATAPAPAATPSPEEQVQAILNKLTDGTSLTDLTPEEQATFSAWAAPATAGASSATTETGATAAASTESGAPATTPTAETKEPVGAGAGAIGLTATPEAVLELNRANARIAQLEITSARDSWAAERVAFEQAGVPPFVLDLAAPFLSGPGSGTIQLAGGQTADAKQAIRQMVDGMKGALDLSKPMAGHGQGATPPADAVDAEAADALAARIAGHIKEHGLK